MTRKVKVQHGCPVLTSLRMRANQVLIFLNKRGCPMSPGRLSRQELAHRLSSVALCPCRLMDSRSFYTAYLQRFSGAIREEAQTTVAPSTANTVAPTAWKVADR